MKEDIPALNMVKKVTVRELVEQYGDKSSNRIFVINDFKSYLLNCYLEEMLEV